MTTTLDNRRTLRAATALDPTESAEIAQARVFERLLKAEHVELQELARRIEQSSDESSASDAAEPVQDLTQIRARLAEIHGLLRALQGRFPAV